MSKKTQYFNFSYITILYQSAKTTRINATHYFIVRKYLAKKNFNK